MIQKNKWIVFILMLIVVFLIPACSGGDSEVTKIEPAQLEPVAGTDFNRVTLTERAAERLGIESEEVREESLSGSMKMVVPYAGLIYGLNGETWVFVRNPGADSLTFVREPVTVEYIEGDMAIVTSGPPVGTHVVTVGVAELYGTDTGVGK